ncbi:MAG: hypothetical protein IJU96_10255 [Clostridia bacterium]|nr:hypothetical protein [Clostridia bacterium]
MMKRITAILFACLLLLGLAAPAFAEEAPAEGNGAQYGNYEDDWFDNGYEGLENEPPVADKEEVPTTQRWFQRLSIVPIVIGVLIAAAAVYLLYQKSRPEPLSPAPFELQAETSVTARQDRLAKEAHTTRSLSATNFSKE